MREAVAVAVILVAAGVGVATVVDKDPEFGNGPRALLVCLSTVVIAGMALAVWG